MTAIDPREAESTEPGSLPEGWITAKVSDLLNLINGFPFKPTHWKTSGLPIIRIQNLNNPRARFNYYPDKIPKKYLVKKGDLLFAWSGTPGTSFGAHIWEGDDAWLNQHIFRVEFDEAQLDKKFLRFAINRNLDEYIANAHGGVGLAHITKTKFAGSYLPIAPLAEQKRIVAKIEELLARVNATRERLAKVPAILKRFRQAVLAAACSGRLTEDWREANPSVESGHELLRRILKERRASWNSKSRELIERGERKLSNSNRQMKYKDPILSNNDLPEIPESWTWASVDSISTKVVDGVHKTPNYVTSGIPFVTVRNLTSGSAIDLENLNYVTEEDHKRFLERANPDRGDLLVSKDGTLGVVRAVRTDRPFSIFVSVALIKPVTTELTDYLEVALSSPQVQQQMVGTGSGLQHIHLRDLRADCVPLAPLEEQKEIVRRVQSLLGLAGGIEARDRAAHSRVDRLTPVLLAKAFRGELVPVEAELARRENRRYEPASSLLVRIRKENKAKQVPNDATLVQRD